MKKIRLLALAVLSAAFLYSCGGGGSSSGGSSTVVEGENTDVTVTMQADYGDARSIIPIYFDETDCADGADSDSPGFEAGTDCDGDSGEVAYLTPTGFKVAIKRLALVMSDETLVDLIADTGTLAASQVIDLENPVLLDISEIPQGSYTGYYAEFYYYDMTMGLYDADDAQLRIYLSDDDFADEGSLGHHQGDIMLRDSSDAYQFVPGGMEWIEANLMAARGSTVGASGADPDTGHLRGLYGDADLWDNNPGAEDDIFVANDILSMTGVSVGSGGGEITITFDLTNTWYFEDFNSNGQFDPCTGIEACDDDSEWSPIFPGVNFDFDLN